MPTVSIITSAFTSLAKTAIKGFGVEDIPSVVIQHPLGGIPTSEAAAKADTAIDSVIEQATKWVPRLAAAETQKAYPAATVTVNDDIEEVNELFYQNAWTDGLPIIPPTEERVAKMLSGTSLKPDQLIGLVPSRMGAATVQVIAINAVMAGTKPQHLPVIIAAVKAALEPAAEFQRWTATTRPTYVSMFVQGPIVKELGIHYGQSALFPGAKPNAAIGRAFNLATRLVGGIISTPDRVGTMTTLGMPNYSYCLGENEDALPKGWSPLRVDSGYKLKDSVVTIFGTTLPLLQNDHDSTNGRDTLMSTCYLIGGQLGRCGGIELGGMVILFGPEHAATIARDGYSKEDVKKFIFENSTTPRDRLVRSGAWHILFETTPGWVKKEVADCLPLIHQFDNPDQIAITVAGGAGKQSICRISHTNPPPAKIQGATLTQAGR